MCAAAVFYYIMNANSTLKAANKVVVKEEKGMTVEEFKKKISQPNKLVMVYFNASWCVPCIKLKPEIAQLEKEAKEFCEVLQINTDDNPKVAEYYEINSLPMFVIYKDGKKLWENIGALTKTQLQSKITAFSK
jgi:thioredoxin